MKSGFLPFWLSGLALTGCDDRAPVPPAPPAVQATTSGATQPRVDPTRIEAAKAAIMAEPKVKDVLYQEGAAVEWMVGMIDDGSPRFGYASYVCTTLGELGVRRGRTIVRITDMGEIAAGADFRAASLGTVRCSDGARLDEAPAVGS